MVNLLKNIGQWVLFVGVLAVGMHFATVRFLPDFIMSRLHDKLTRQVPVNTMQYPARPDASARAVVKPSPDLIYAICAYDVSEGPVRVTSPVPNSYWSLSAFANNTDNFLAINDAQAGGDRVDLILTQPGRKPNNPDMLPVIEAQTPTGVILTRTLITSEEDFPALNALRQQATCSPYVDEAP